MKISVISKADEKRLLKIYLYNNDDLIVVYNQLINIYEFPIIITIEC